MESKKLDDLFAVSPEQKKIGKRLVTMIKKYGQVFWDALFGVESYWGLCECGRYMDHLNVYKSNFMYCKKCNTSQHIGGNLITTWRDENETIWRKNQEILEKARPIEGRYPHMMFPFGGSRLMTIDEIKQACAKHCPECSESRSFIHKVIAKLRDYELTPAQRKIVELGPGEFVITDNFNADWDRTYPPGRRPNTPSAKEAGKALPSLSDFHTNGVDRSKCWAAHREEGVSHLVYHFWNTYRNREAVVIYEPEKFSRWVKTVNKPVAKARQELYLKLVGEGKQPKEARRIADEAHLYVGQESSGRFLNWKIYKEPEENDETFPF